jgi:RNA polymerase sigma-70 factor, ECF subfamily
LNSDKQEKYMELYSPLAGNLFAFCFAKTHNREEAKELVSETILASYENFHTLKNEKAFLSFLFTIATNVYKAKYKISQRFVLSGPELFETMYETSLSPEVETDIKILFEFMDKLPVVQREAIYLFDIIGMTQKEIAEIQKTTIMNIKLRIYRGKKKLSELVKEKKIKKAVQILTFNSIQNIEAI